MHEIVCPHCNKTFTIDGAGCVGSPTMAGRFAELAAGGPEEEQ